MPKIKHKTRKRKKKKTRLSPVEKKRRRIARKFKTDINTVFKNAGFVQIPTRGRNFDLCKRTIEIDNVFIHENIIVVCEDTTIKRPHDIRDHLNNTAQVYRHIETFFDEFIDALEINFERFGESKDPRYSNHDLRIVFVYCSYNKVDTQYKSRHNSIIFFDYAYLQYFLRLSKTISRSIRFEIFKFLKLSLRDIGLSRAGGDVKEYDGYLLPESPSGYPHGYKIVSFLIEPQRLLEQSYVLRKDSWKDSECLYQRLLMPTKIKNMRGYLVAEGRVFVNNIIVSLPENTKLLDKNGNPVSAADLTHKREVTVQFPREINTIGIIDGQHRVFSYHEGIDELDKTISTLREKQHLLLTGIIYPRGTSEHEKAKFEAQLFLEINDKQTSTKADLKQAIELIIHPFSVIAISKRILNNLSNTGPLSGYLEEYFFDTKKIKTSSIVSFGLRNIIKFSGTDTFFSIWRNSDKQKLPQGKGKKVLDVYVQFCTKKMNDLLEGFRANIPDEMWTTDRKVSRVLTTTTINGLIFCLRKLIENRKMGNYDYYKRKFKKMKVDFKPEKFEYKSSHWKGLGEKIYNDCFE